MPRSTGWRGRCRSTRRGRRRARRAGRPDRGPGCARNIATKRGRMMLELGVEAVWAASPRTSRCCTCSSTSTRRAARAAARHRGRRPAGPLRGRLAADRAPDGRGLGESGCSSARRCGGSSTAPDGVTVHADGVTVRGRRAIVAIPPTLAGRIAYDPPLPGYRDQLTQRMPLGAVIKCMAIYDEPFWRAEGLTGQAHQRRRPGEVTFDNSPPGRLARRAARLPRGPPRARARAGAARSERRTAVIDCFARLFGPRAATPDDYVERTGPRRSGRAAATAATCPPAAGPTTAPRCASRSARCTGPAPRRDGLERLHGRRGAVGRALRRRGPCCTRGLR